MTTPLLIDGASGEGGGQILRTSLALSVITGRPFRIVNIRGNRPKPGLRRQHMTGVLAAAAICGAQVEGAAVDSREVSFTPPAGGRAWAGNYVFDVGSAGSTMLVLQTVLPALMIADGPSTITLSGGTHNFGAPPFLFLEKAFLPLVNRMGPRIELRIDRAGFAPRGGGRAHVRITPSPLRKLEIMERGAIRHRLARASIAGLPREIADRELRVAARVLEWRPDEVMVDEWPADQGPGNLVTVEVEAEHVTEVFTAFGAKGTPAEDVARAAAREAKHHLSTDVPVGEHLADQLLLPLALAGGGAFLTGDLSLHATTNIETIRKFLDVAVDVREVGKHRVEVRVGE
jgi:RNA 3'-terminal phosphate cyclase (ATP)